MEESSIEKYEGQIIDLAKVTSIVLSGTSLIFSVVEPHMSNQFSRKIDFPDIHTARKYMNDWADRCSNEFNWGKDEFDFDYED